MTVPARRVARPDGPALTGRAWIRIAAAGALALCFFVPLGHPPDFYLEDDYEPDPQYFSDFLDEGLGSIFVGLAYGWPLLFLACGTARRTLWSRLWRLEPALLVWSGLVATGIASFGPAIGSWLAWSAVALHGGTWFIEAGRLQRMAARTHEVTRNMDAFD